MCDLDGRLADVGDPQPGSTHDAKAFAESGIAERWQAHHQPGGRRIAADKGYQGTGITTPDKKPPGGQLTEAQKRYNTSVNRIRTAVERRIAHLKNWKILKTGYRRQLTDFPQLLRTVTKLEIFRLWGFGF